MNLKGAKGTQGTDCALNCKTVFSSGKLTLFCPLGLRNLRYCLSIFTFWSMHLKGLTEMEIRMGDTLEALDQPSVRWIRAYASAARKALDGAYLQLLGGAVGAESSGNAYEVYSGLGAIYDGTLMSQREHTRSCDLHRFLTFLGRAAVGNSLDAFRLNLQKSLRDIPPFDVFKSVPNSRGSVRGISSEAERETYMVGPLSVRIVEAPICPNPIYGVAFLDHRTARLIFELSRLIKLKSSLEGCYVRSFRDLIEHRRDYATDYLHFLCDGPLPEGAEAAVCSHAAYSSVGLGKYYALLVDDAINEFYIDAPAHRVYLDHQRWDRCQTNIRLGEGDIEHLITHLRRETNQRLDYSIPSMKADLSCADFNIRASIDAAPLTKDGTALDVRRFRRVPLTVLDLIANKTLNVESAAFLLFCLLFRRTITVVGETSSGKTTLVNAIDIGSPRWWRKITIEDTVESVPQLRYGRHQVRIQVEPLEQGPATRLKSTETTRLLHRNPTYVLLGEIQTPEHSKALFQALASGLRVIHTVHASSIEALMRRFLIQHEVSMEDLKSLELIVFIRNFLGFRGRWRRVMRISELEITDEVHVIINDIASYNFESDTQVPSRDPSKLEIVRKMLKEYPMSVGEAMQVLDSYKRFLTHLYPLRGNLPFRHIVKEFDSFNARIAREFHLFEPSCIESPDMAIAGRGGAS